MTVKGRKMDTIEQRKKVLHSKIQRLLKDLDNLKLSETEASRVHMVGGINQCLRPEQFKHTLEQLNEK
jgi:coproporphyrinogen III oxidase-like Fe-S oxidoreductase